MAPIEINMAQVYRSLVDLFEEEDLQTFCEIYLGIDYGSLSGRNKDGKAREIIKEMRRQERNGELVALVAKFRPNALKMKTGRLEPPPDMQITDSVDLAGKNAFDAMFIGQSRAEIEWLRRLSFIMLGVIAAVLLVLLIVAVLG